MDSTVDEQCSLLREWLSLAGVEKTAIRSMVALQLTDKAFQHLDAQRLDSLDSEPAWLRAMCSEPRWRTVLYDMCAATPSCVLLQTAVRELSKGEHATEIAMHPSLRAVIGKASSLQAFTNALALQLGGRQYEQTSQNALDAVGSAGELQHFSAQLLLSVHLLRQTDHPISAVLEQSIARMTHACMLRHRQSACRLQLLASGVPRQSPIMSCMVSILTADYVSPADANLLQELFSQHSPTSDLLRSTQLVQKLLQALFDPCHPPKPAQRELLLRSLANVANIEQPQTHTVVISTDDGSSILSMLREAQATCESNEVSEIRTSVGILHRCSTHPVVACGIMLWIFINLTNPRFSGARYNSAFMPVVLQLVAAIAEQHESLGGATCTLLFSCLLHDPPTDSDTNALAIVEIRRKLLDCLLMLMLQGHIVPVLSAVAAWLPDADLALVRHLVQQLLNLVSPPYSFVFAESILAILRHPRTLEAHRDGLIKRPLVEFAQDARSVVGLQQSADTLLEMLA